MPLPLVLAAAAAPQVYKLFQGLRQRAEADNLKLRDTTPPAFREALGLGRQGYAAALPGLGAALNRVEATTNDTVAAATRAGTSSNSVLGLLEKSDANRRRELGDLNARGDAFRQQQAGKLTTLLSQQAGYEARDQQELDRGRAALREGSERNIYGALDGASQIGAYALDQPAPTAADVTADGSGAGLSPIVPDGLLPIDPRTGRRMRYNQYGFYGPGESSYSPASGYGR